MVSKQLIEDFFDEQFQNTSQFFLYKDKKLLKQDKYREFAEEQLKKASQIFWSVAGSLLIASWYGITSLVKYGSDPTWFNLSFWVDPLVFDHRNCRLCFQRILQHQELHDTAHQAFR
ncbi:hypothetical protein [Rhodohalobacter sp.]|uniref:hypothetical protein n=1 Tax=Rhodohalobacter sp. TaxID=1974210 RepID=UPI002ACE9673|nr:hypothetical protein [Rhodohalobacter sp.]MDZ7756189.1 hypothetical protein [Rhodohalobacter sp.]